MTNSHDFPRRWLAIWTAAIIVFLLAPLVVVIFVSLTPLDHISLPTSGISLRWYAQLADQHEFMDAVINSILLALKSAATALVLGVLASLAIVRHTFRLREVVRISVTAPLFIPMVMTGLAILTLSAQFGWMDPPTRLYVAHCSLTLPYVVRTVSASLTGFDINQELAARCLGASPLRAFFLVTLPQLGPGLFAGTVFAFIVSFDNVGLSIFLTGPQYSTLPVQLFLYATYDSNPMVAAASVLMIVFSIASVALLERFFGLRNVMRA